MSFGLIGRYHRVFYALTFLGLLLAADVARAGIGLDRSLTDRIGANYLLRRPVRGLSAFQNRPLVPPSAEVKETAKVDSSYQFVRLTIPLKDTDIYQPVPLEYESYKRERFAYDVRKDYQELIRRVYKRASQRRSGEGVAIDVPFKIKSKTFRRLFGGDNVGVRVSGNIAINGNVRRQQFDEQQAFNQQNANTSFRIDMTQQFSITGKIGQKVEVKVDQDSERILDFQNSLKLTYTGDEDEIVQKVEAGNVALNLGTRLATFSGRNTGLFGVKTEAKVGALKLTGIASLERGQKNRQSPNQDQQRASFTEKEFIQNMYFWITDQTGFITDTLSGERKDYISFRDNYRNYSNREHVLAYDPNYSIQDIEVYVSTTQSGNPTETEIFGRAAVLQDLNSLYADTFQIDADHVTGNWRKLSKGVDYDLENRLGYIRLRQPIQASQMLAVAFSTVAGDTFGKLDANLDNLSLVLIKRNNPQPTDLTWNLMFRHVYSFGATGLDPTNFKLTINRETAQAGQNETGPPGSTFSYLEFFDFDLEGEGGTPGADGKVDNVPAIVNWSLGELHFLDLTPFDPSGYFEGGVETGWDFTPYEVGQDTAGFSAPYLYNTPISQHSQQGVRWRFTSEYKGSTSVFRLGALVLEGSEEVKLNGQPLARGTDYTIDYLSGELRILNEAAKAPGAALEITYESGQFFQLDKKTLLGARAEYGLWQDSYIGGMVLHLNESTLDKRVRIGNEPIRNTLYDANANLKFKPNFLSRIVDAAPMIKTESPSDLQIEGEVAKVFPNPNSLENGRTGDYNGLAYLDDFEGSRRSSPIGLQRRQWTNSSIPVDARLLPRRGRMVWYNPNTDRQVPVKDVFPERETNSQVANTLQSLVLEYTPPVMDADSMRRSWGGIMRFLGDGYADQSRAQFLEFWIQVPASAEGDNPTLVVDLGEISEDAIPNGKMDSEDRPEAGQEVTSDLREYGNGVLNPETEDTGIDGDFGDDPNDTDFWNGNDQPAIASNDNWSHESGSDDFEHVNGTERNKNDDGGGFPDTEDLFDNDLLDENNAYFSYRISLDFDSPYIVGGEGNPKNWRLFRIPLAVKDSAVVDTIGSANKTSVRWARMYMTGVSRKTKIQLVQNDIVSNEWLAQFIGADSTEYITSAVINSHENPGYRSPPGVEGEIDPITQLRQREQSLVLKINQLGGITAEGRNAPDSFFVAKNLYENINLLEYKKLKMFVHGGGEEPILFPDNKYQLTLRFGQNYTNLNTNFYDVVLTVHPDWDPRNEIDLAMNDLSQLHTLRAVAAADPDNHLAPTGRYAIPFGTDPGDSLVISGTPTLSRVGFIAIGITKFDKYYSGSGDEIWVDELRVSDIYKDPGTAAELNATLRLADFVSLAGGYSQRDADFHNVNTRIGTNESSQGLRGNLTLNLHKIAVERWGFQLPLTVTHNESESIPRYVPGTDTRIDPGSISDSLRNAIRGLQTSTNYTIRYSKTGNSRNPLVRYSLEKLSAGYDHSRDERSDYNIQKSENTTEGANLGYSFPTAKGRGIAPLFWIKRVPVLGMVGSPKLFFKPTRLSGTFRADKRDGLQVTRPVPQTRYAGTDSATVVFSQQRTSSESFGNSRAFTLGFSPVEPVNIEGGRTIRGQFLADSVFAGLNANNDSLHRYYIKEDWTDLLNGAIGRNTDIQQQVNTTYSPQFASWLRPTFSYGAQYNWNRRNFTQNNSEAVGNQRTFGTDVTLDFRAIFGGGGGGRNRDRRGRDGRAEEREREGGPEKDKLPLPGGRAGGDPKDGAPRFEEPDRLPKDRFGPQSGSRGDKGGAQSSDTTQALADTALVQGDSLGGAGIEKPRGMTIGQRLSAAISPIRYMLMMLDPIAVGYDNSASHQIGAVHGFGADWRYQLGFEQEPGLPKDSGYTSSPQKRNDQTITARSGIRLTSNIRTTINYSNRESENIAEGNLSQSTGNREETTFWLGRKITFEKDSAGNPTNSKTEGVALPFVDVSVDWSGFEKIGFIGKYMESASLASGYAGKVRENWAGSASSVEARDYTRTWNPLLGINLSWKVGLESQIRYNSSTTYQDGIRLKNRSRSSDQQITATVSYTIRTGFRLPVLWLSSIRLQNQTTLSLNGDYRTQKQERTLQANSDQFSTGAQTTSWSIQPRMTYSFSNTVQGQGYLQFQSTKDEVRDSGSRLFEFGIQVNIAIRG